MTLKSSIIKRRAYVWAVIVVFAFVLRSQAVAQVGIVHYVSGVWDLFQNGRHLGDIQGGQGIPSGSRAWPRSGGGKLVIHLYDDRVIVCEPLSMKQCEQPFVLRRRSSRPSRFFAAFKSVVLPRAPNLIRAFGRPSVDERGELIESIIRLEEDKIDLAETFASMQPGSYLIRLVPLQHVSRKEALGRFRFQWKPGTSSKASIPKITPGLYELFVFDRREDPEPLISTWILVADDARFLKISRRFAEARRWSRRWSSRTGPEAEHAFLGGYMYSLYKSVK